MMYADGRTYAGERKDDGPVPRQRAYTGSLVKINEFSITYLLAAAVVVAVVGAVVPPNFARRSMLAVSHRITNNCLILSPALPIRWNFALAHLLK